MIDYIKYTIDDKSYSLTNNGDGTWSREENAPSVAGNYLLAFIVSENGIVTSIDSSNSLYDTYLQVVVETERTVYLEKLVPDFIAETNEFGVIFEIEDEAFDDLHTSIERIKSDAFITTASGDAITRIETFMGIKGVGTLSQRKSYLITMLQKGKKISETAIKEIANTITGSDCIITFFTADETSNPFSGYGLLRVRILSPDSSKDYRYEDIARALRPLVPAHIKLSVIKFFASWSDISDNFLDWDAVKSLSSWEAVKDYIPPQ